MEDHDFLEEILGLRRETWENFPVDISEFLSSGGTFDACQVNPTLVLPYPSSDGLAISSDQTALDSSMNEVYCPFGDAFSVKNIDHFSREKHDAVPSLIQEDYHVVEDENLSLLGDSFNNLDKQRKVEVAQDTQIPGYDIVHCLGRKNRVKKLDGQPSKNLMAERRRRKRLNDRLTMLRSVVPKISKMDRTSILGDTIEYMKELMDRIKKMQEDLQVGGNQMNLMNIFQELKSNEILVRNTPKFDVERRSTDTRLAICCAAKPGLLLSTVTSLEALGLEIQQCVISCFNDFGLQASCTEDVEQRATVSCEDIKQALFRNAGYGGRCM